MMHPRRLGDGREARLGGAERPRRRGLGNVARLLGAAAAQARAACGSRPAAAAAAPSSLAVLRKGAAAFGPPALPPSGMPECGAGGARSNNGRGRPTAIKGGQGYARIPYLALSVAQAVTCRGRHQVALGSGFFYESGGRTYYVTNRHLVAGENGRRCPDSIMLRLHTDPSDIASSRDVSLDLYDDGGRPLWREHPAYGKDIDVAAIPAGQGRLNGCAIFPLSRARQVPDKTVLELGQDLMVVGFPEGLSDATHNLPIARNASLASLYMVPFGGRPCMLVDAMLHPGASGSPVLTKRIFNARRPDGSVAASTTGAMHLVGIHSAGAYRSARGRAVEGGPLGLNLCWFASLLDDMT